MYKCVSVCGFYYHLFFFLLLNFGVHMLRWDQRKYLLIGLSLKITYTSEHIEYCNITKKKSISYKLVMSFKMAVRTLTLFNLNVEISSSGISFKILTIKKIRTYCKSYSKANTN